MTETPGKDALLAQIERERALWEQLVAAVGEEQMLTPGATGPWTFKDVVAHLHGWRANTLVRLEAARQGQVPGAPPWPAHLDEEADVDLVNDWLYQANRDRPLRDVLDEYRLSFSLIRDAVSALSEQDLTAPDRYDWMQGKPLASVILGSFEHLHEEHEPTLREWLARRSQPC